MLGFAVAFEMLLVDVVRYNPGWVVSLVADSPGSGGSSPVIAAESYREGKDDIRMHAVSRRFRFAALYVMRLGVSCMRESALANSPPTANRGWVVVIQPHLGNVHHDPVARRIRQDVFGRDDNHFSDRRRPPVHVIVGVRD